jgi:hypothetical protein
MDETSEQTRKWIEKERELSHHKMSIKLERGLMQLLEESVVLPKKKKGKKRRKVERREKVDGLIEKRPYLLFPKTPWYRLRASKILATRVKFFLVWSF